VGSEERNFMESKPAIQTLTPDDIDILLTALDHAKFKAESTNYPEYAMKQAAIAKLDDVGKKLQALKKSF
jgi:hypothetical protein